MLSQLQPGVPYLYPLKTSPGLLILESSFNPFTAAVLIIYPMETTEQPRFSDSFWGYRKEPVTWNYLMSLLVPQINVDRRFNCWSLILVEEGSRLLARKHKTFTFTSYYFTFYYVLFVYFYLFYLRNWNIMIAADQLMTCGERFIQSQGLTFQKLRFICFI